MGTTTKIIFGCTLAISIVVMFLAFSMQKSAQLSLDIQDIQHTVQEKEQQITAIQQSLTDTETAVENAKAKSAIIPGLKNTIASAEQEKHVYLQQLDELQSQLQKAETHLTAYGQLQEEFKNHQLLLADTEKAKISADMQTVKTTEELKALQNKLEQRDEQTNQFIANLKQRDHIIQVYQEKLIKMVDEINLLQEEDSTERLNLNLILDELAVKTFIIEELTRRIIELGGSAEVFVTTTEKADKKEEPATQANSQALVEQLALENDTLIKTLKERDTLIQDLHTEIQTRTVALVAGKTKIEQLQADAKKMSEELNALRLVSQENQEQLAQLNSTLSDKEDERMAAQELAFEISVPLTKKITTLEQQLALVTENNSKSLAEFDKAKTLLTGLQRENKQLVTTLHTTQGTLQEVLEQKAQLESDSLTAQTSLQHEQDELQALSAEIEPLKTALTQSEEQFKALNNQSEALHTQLTALQEEKEQNAGQVQSLADQLAQQAELAAQLTAVQTSLKEAQQQIAQSTSSSDTQQAEIETLAAAVTEKETTIQTLTSQLTENTARLAELEKAPQVSADDIAQQEQRISKLVEEAAAAKALAETQTAARQSTEQELAGLKETAASNSDIEEKNAKLTAALLENQTQQENDQKKISNLETVLASIEEERNKLLLYTIDSDNDGVSDAIDKCPDTPEEANVNAEGCEEDSDHDGLVNRLDLCPDTASGSATDNAGCSSEQSTVVLEGITFQLGTSELTENAQSALKHAAIILEINTDITMEVAGHTDSIGDPDSNLRLSTERAKAVLNYLTSQGIAEERLSAKGYGSNEPIAENTSNTGRALNRRVELRRIDNTDTPQTETEPDSVQ